MVFEKVSRNFDGVEFEVIRKKVDEEFNVLHDELSVCYYDFWRYGKSKEFDSGSGKYDVQSSVEASKLLFDKLHGALYDVYSLKLIEENELLVEKDRFSKLSDMLVKDAVSLKSEKDLIDERILVSKVDDGVDFDLSKLSLVEVTPVKELV